MWWRRALVTVALIALLPLMAAATASAQTACGKHGDVLAEFQKRYGETRNAIGLTDQGGLIEVLVSPTGTWTMVLTMPNAPSCIIGTGRQWYQLTEPENGPTV